jgi:hypothetical protein
LGNPITGRKEERDMNYRVFNMYKRLSARFSIETLERHWDKLIAIVTNANA